MSSRITEIKRRLKDLTHDNSIDEFLNLTSGEIEKYMALAKNSFHSGIINVDEYKLFDRVLNNWDYSDDLSRQVTIFVLQTLEELGSPILVI